MITSIFKNNPLSHLLIVLMSLAIWFWNYTEVPASENFEIVIGGEKLAMNKKFWLIVSFFATLIPAWFLNFRLKRQLFNYQPNNLFLFFYVLIVGLGITTPDIIVYTIIATFLVVFVSYLLSFNEKESNRNQIFNASFVVGLLLFHNMFFVLLLLVLIQNLSTFRQVTLRDFFMMLSGFFFPYLFVLAISLLADNNGYLSSTITTVWLIPKIQFGQGVLIIFLSIIGFLGYRLVIQKRTGIDVTVLRLTRNIFTLLIGSIILCGVSVFLEVYEFVYFILAIPLSILLTDYFANSKFKWREALFGVVVLSFFTLLF